MDRYHSALTTIFRLNGLLQWNKLDGDQFMRSIAATFLLCGALFAQESLTPSKAQHGKLVSQRDALVKLQTQLMKLQNEIGRLQGEYVYELGRLHQSCREVIVANGWPSAAQCDTQSLGFTVAPPPAPLTPQMTVPPEKSGTPKDAKPN